MTLKLILLAIGASLLLLAVQRLRQYRLKERYTLVFIFIGTPFLVLAMFPNALGAFAKYVQIPYQTVALLCVTAFFLLMVLELLTIVSQQDRKITTLAQMVGILMSKQEELKQGSAINTAEETH
jgi:hypothetical protein